MTVTAVWLKAFMMADLADDDGQRSFKFLFFSSISTKVLIAALFCCSGHEVSLGRLLVSSGYPRDGLKIAR